MHFVYGISSILDGGLYIGKENIEGKRFDDHIQEAKISKKKTKKLSWIRKILKESPESLFHMTISGPFPTECEAFFEERRLILKHRLMGHNVKNSTWGGDGGKTYDWDDTRHEKHSAYLRSRWQDENYKKLICNHKVSKKISDSISNRVNNRIKCLETGEIFNNASLAARHFSMTRKVIRKSVKTGKSHKFRKLTFVRI